MGGQIISRKDRCRMKALQQQRIGRTSGSCMVKFSQWTFFSLLFLELVQVCFCSGRIEIKFLHYRGDSCKNKSTKCDPHFEFCLGTVQTGSLSLSSGKCQYGYSSKSSILGIPNPWTISTTLFYDPAVNEQDVRLMLVTRVVDWDKVSSDDEINRWGSTYVEKVWPSKSQAIWQQHTSTAGAESLSFKIRLYCDPDYYGVSCNTYCRSSGHYNCDRKGNKVCHQGWEGSSCQNDIDECKTLANACNYAGRCTNTQGSYTCDCLLPYTGSRCQNHPCNTSPCVNGGTCNINQYGDIICSCSDRWTGQRCQLADPCYSRPCRNGGICSSQFLNQVSPTYNCSCSYPYSGKNCEISITTTTTTATSTSTTTTGSPVNFEDAAHIITESEIVSGGDTKKTIRCGMTQDILDVRVIEVSLSTSDTCGEPGTYTDLAHIDFWAQQPVIDSNALTTDVSGSIDQDDDTVSFLKLTLNIPAEFARDRRCYKCVIQGIKDNGEPVSAFTNVEEDALSDIMSNPLSLSELIYLKLESLVSRMETMENRMTNVPTADDLRNLQISLDTMENRMTNVPTADDLRNLQISLVSEIEDKIKFHAKSSEDEAEHYKGGHHGVTVRQELQYFSDFIINNVTDSCLSRSTEDKYLPGVDAYKYYGSRGYITEYHDIFGTGIANYRLAFRGTAHVGSSLYLAYKYGAGLPSYVEDGCKSTNFSESCSSHYRNNDALNNWCNIEEVVFGIVDDKTLVKTITFNGADTTYMDWFQQTNLRHSSYVDLKTESKNFFSIDGDQVSGGEVRIDRNFFISRSYVAGCHTDTGWVVASHQNPVCQWEINGAIPNLLYSGSQRYINWTTGDRRDADAFVIFVKYRNF